MNGGLIKSCELVARVRSGRVVKAGSNGVVMYNAAWYEKHKDTELRRCGVWEETGYFAWLCSCCGKISHDKDLYCPNCGARMSKDIGIRKAGRKAGEIRKEWETRKAGEIRKRGTWRELYYGETKYYLCSVCATAFPMKHIWCPICKTQMDCGLKTGKEED